MRKPNSPMRFSVGLSKRIDFYDLHFTHHVKPTLSVQSREFNLREPFIFYAQLITFNCCYVNMVIIISSPMIGHLLDTVVLASTDRDL